MLVGDGAAKPVAVAKNWLSQLLRRRALQTGWVTCHRWALVAMNFSAWDVHSTGELDAIRWVSDRLPDDRPRTIFDVGANVGDYSDLCLQRMGPNGVVHAFEPSRPTFDRLRERFSSATPSDRLHLHNLGFSDSHRPVTLYSPEPGSTIASVHRLERPIGESKDEYSETVELTTIDEFCANNAIERIDLLKLDIEGHELAALNGAERMLKEGRIRFIQFEFGENNIGSRTYMADFHRLLSAHDYVLYRIVPGGPFRSPYEGGRSEIFATMNYLCELRRVRGD